MKIIAINVTRQPEINSSGFLFEDNELFLERINKALTRFKTVISVTGTHNDRLVRIYGVLRSTRRANNEKL